MLIAPVRLVATVKSDVHALMQLGHVRTCGLRGCAPVTRGDGVADYTMPLVALVQVRDRVRQKVGVEFRKCAPIQREYACQAGGGSHTKVKDFVTAAEAGPGFGCCHLVDDGIHRGEVGFGAVLARKVGETGLKHAPLVDELSNPGGVGTVGGGLWHGVTRRALREEGPPAPAATALNDSRALQLGEGTAHGDLAHLESRRHVAGGGKALTRRQEAEVRGERDAGTDRVDGARSPDRANGAGAEGGRQSRGCSFGCAHTLSVSGFSSSWRRRSR